MPQPACTGRGLSRQERGGEMNVPTLSTCTIALIIILLSCADRDHEAHRRADRAQTTASPGDTTEISRRYAEIDSLHARMMAQYRAMGETAPREMQHLYGSIDSMHASASQMHREMMSSGGMMRDRRMMGGRMMEERRNDDTTRPGGPRMHREPRMRQEGERHGTMPHDAMMSRRRTWEWDQQMAAMHAQIGAHMRAQGHEEMADLHDEMAQRFRNAMDALADENGASTEGAARGSDREGGEEGPIGRTIFARECAACHTGAAGGSGPGTTGAPSRCGRPACTNGRSPRRPS